MKQQCENYKMSGHIFIQFNFKPQQYYTERNTKRKLKE